MSYIYSHHMAYRIFTKLIFFGFIALNIAQFLIFIHTIIYSYKDEPYVVIKFQNQIHYCKNSHRTDCGMNFDYCDKGELIRCANNILIFGKSIYKINK